MFRHIQIKRSVLVAAGIAAAALPASAQARPFFDPPTVAQTSQPAKAASVVRRPEANASTGFQWDDAGIGAAGAIVLLGAGAGTATTIRRRRTRRVATA